jgi:hypothetical protein
MITLFLLSSSGGGAGSGSVLRRDGGLNSCGWDALPGAPCRHGAAQGNQEQWQARPAVRAADV